MNSYCKIVPSGSFTKDERPRSKQAVRQFDIELPCHSEFISESLNFNVLHKAEILKQVQDDNFSCINQILVS